MKRLLYHVLSIFSDTIKFSRTQNVWQLGARIYRSVKNVGDIDYCRHFKLNINQLNNISVSECIGSSTILEIKINKQAIGRKQSYLGSAALLGHCFKYLEKYDFLNLNKISIFIRNKIKTLSKTDICERKSHNTSF